MSELKRVLLYGDSNTFGFDPKYGGDPVREGLPYPSEQIWTNILAKKLGDGYEVFVDAVTGRTTAYDRVDKTDPDEIFAKNGLSSLPGAIKKYAPLDYFAVMLGTNDCNKDMELSAEQICSGLESLLICCDDELKKYTDKQARFVIIAPASIKGDITKSTFDYQLDDSSVEKSEKIAALYKELAKKYDALFIEESAKLEVSPIDCEHLTAASHEKLAEMVAKMIQNNEI